MSNIATIRPNLTTKLRAGEVFNVLENRPLHNNRANVFFAGSGWKLNKPWTFLITQGDHFVEVPIWDTKRRYCGFSTREEAMQYREAFNLMVEQTPTASSFILLGSGGLNADSYLVDHVHYRTGDKAWQRIAAVPNQPASGRYTHIHYTCEHNELAAAVSFDGFEIIRIMPE